MVFQPRTATLEDLYTGNYRLSRATDEFSLLSRPLVFRVATAYKRKAQKVRPVDPSSTDGSSPSGAPDWVERSKATDIAYLSGRFSEWLVLKFLDIQRGEDRFGAPEGEEES